MSLPIAWILIGLLIAQRLGELVYAKRNTKALLARGATEHGASHYPFMVAIHTAFLVCLVLFVKPFAPINWLLVVVFVALQLSRVWVIASLGPYWTTRVISAPDFPLEKRGPYKWLKHPNYVVVTLEILVVPLMFGPGFKYWWIAAIFTVLNACILYVRISVENDALSKRD